MTPKVKILYRDALNDKRFVQTYESVDKDSIPNMWSDNLFKSLFATAYYGYLMAVNPRQARSYDI